MGTGAAERDGAGKSEGHRPLQPDGGYVDGGGDSSVLTIYHWDMPQALEDRGGWPNRDLAGYYAEFAGTLAKHLVTG